MKIPIAMIASLLWLSQPAFAVEHLKDSRSPIMTTEVSEGGMKGVWIPDTYGGITGVLLDLDQVGSNKMLSIRLAGSKGAELRPFTGDTFKVHSDLTTEDKKSNTTTRTVILIDEFSLKRIGRKEIICYKVVFQEGIPGRSEQTHYSLTFSSIKDEFEVQFLIPFRASFPNRDHPDASKPTLREQGGAEQPAAASELKPSGIESPNPESDPSPQ